MPNIIQATSRVSFHLRMSMESGFVVEDTWQDQPVQVALGEGELIEGLELALQGMAVGEEKTIELSPEVAFGPWDSSRVMEMPIADFPSELAIEKGKIIGFTAPSGEELAGAIREIHENTVEVDFNHPMAGKNAVFDIKVLDVE